MNDRISLLLIRAHYALLNGSLRLLKSALYENPDPASVKRLLVVRKGNLGDIVCSMPAFSAILKSFSNASVDLLTTPGKVSTIAADQVLPSGMFERIIDFNSLSRSTLFQTIRDANYDAVIELSPDVDTWANQLRNLLFFRMAGIRSGFGWQVTNTLFLRKAQLHRLTFPNEQERLAAMLKLNGIAVNDEYGSLFSEADVVSMEAKLGKLRSARSNRVAVAVGAKFERKQWPIENFKEVVDDLLGKGSQVVLVGDEKDAELTKEWSHPSLINACGKLTIRESAALLAQCRLTLTNDSGPMHLSYAVGTPVLALFSARNYKGKWNPPADRKNKVLVSYDVHCAICRDKVCVENVCMKAIAVSAVAGELGTIR